MKTKLSIFITSLSGGGAERVVSILLSQLKKDFDIILVLMNSTIVYDIPVKDIQILYLEDNNFKESGIKKILKLPILAWRYKKICEFKKIDISLSFMYRPNFINVLAKLLGLQCKVFISERNTPSEVYAGKSFSSLVGKILIKSLYDKADKIIANSKGNALDLIKNFNISNSILTVIENPFDLKNIMNKSNENIEFDVPNKFIFIIVGRLEEHKRHILAVEAFSRLKDTNSELWILGCGPMEDNIRNAIEKFKIKDRVKVLGFDKNPYKFMSKADCFILCSIREGFPNVLVEAMACGLPIISTDCHSGPREILSPNSDISLKLKSQIEMSEYGMLIPMDEVNFLQEAMEKMMKDKNLFDRYQNKSKNRANKFNVTNIIYKFKEILASD